MTTMVVAPTKEKRAKTKLILPPQSVTMTPMLSQNEVDEALTDLLMTVEPDDTAIGVADHDYHY